jgi:hypothetical protein
MFIIAGIVEGFVTPSHIPGIVKIVFGAALGFLTVTYLATAGRDSTSERPSIVLVLRKTLKAGAKT